MTFWSCLVDSRRAIVDPAQRMAAFGRVREAVRAVADVADAALSDLTP